MAILFIPAYAGLSFRLTPLTCGGSGSSPRARGFLPLPVRPAYPCTVHPRIRGVIVCTFKLSMIICGSSPHTRGYPNCPKDLLEEQRFIPAYAGLSSGIVRKIDFVPVHPRIRGVIDLNRGAGVERNRFIPAYAGLSSCTASSRHAMYGSSPHTRGYLTKLTVCTTMTTVHPRIRGVIGIILQVLPGN